MPNQILIAAPEGLNVIQCLQWLKDSHSPIFFKILEHYDKASIMAWLAYATGLIEENYPQARILLTILQSIADSNCGLAEAKSVTVRGAELPLVGHTCVLAALLSYVLQPPPTLTTVPERLRYLRAAVRLLRNWCHKFVTKQAMPATMCGVLRCPVESGLPTELWLGTSPPRNTGDGTMKQKAKEARDKLVEGTGVWAEQVGRFPAGSCAETFPLSVLLRSKTGASDMYSLAIRNKDGEDIKACDTCTATLANTAQLPGLTILDMALPEYRWMYGEGEGEGEEAYSNGVVDGGGGGSSLDI
ncbi:hypothetical protein TWF506_009094 [Arthrobotrys conoides]|uniref:Uncharacterized protein n=1 Tax=Arthrobotrys conoides TaxID=74498 RepID=A0AAN8NBS8_9PEZI